MIHVRLLIALGICLTSAISTFGETLDFSAMALVQLPAAELQLELEALEQRYDGSAASELLTAAALFEHPPEDDGLNDHPQLDRADAARAQARLLSLVRQWPNATTQQAVADAIKDNDPDMRQMALRVADAMARAPKVAQALTTVKTPEERLLVERARHRHQVPATAPVYANCVGADLLVDYPDAKVQLQDDRLAILVCQIDGSKPAFPNADTASAANAVLRRGGSVVFHNASDKWPDDLQRWCNDHGVQLPGAARATAGPGSIYWPHYAACADTPYDLHAQPGHAADIAWHDISPNQRTPIRTADKAGALLVAQHNVGNGGTVIFTSVNLGKRRLYAENVLQWLTDGKLAALRADYAGNYGFSQSGSTSHVPWAKPLAGKKLRVLYLSDNLLKRGGLELTQRLDCELRYVPYDVLVARPYHKNSAERPVSQMSPRAIDAFLAHLSWADVLLVDCGRRNLLRSLTQELVGDIDLNCMPLFVREKIWQRIHSGDLGLVVTSSARMVENGGISTAFTSRVGLQATRAGQYACPQTIAELPLSADADPRYLGTCPGGSAGKGRVVWFNRRLPHLEPGVFRVPELDVPSHWQCAGLLESQQHVNAHEYLHAQWVAAVAWAGRHALAEGRQEGNWHWQYRNKWNDIVAQGQSDDQAPLPTGSYILEKIAKDANGNVVDFATRLHEVTGPKMALKPEQRFVPTDSDVVIEVILPEGASGKLHLRAYDAFDRLLATIHHPIQQANTTLAFRIPHPRSRLVDCHVDWLNGERLVAHERQPIALVLPPRPRDFDLTASLKQAELYPFFGERMGVNVTYGAPELALRHGYELSSGAWSSPIGIGPTPTARLTPKHRNPCLSSPSFRMQAVHDVNRLGPQMAALGITDYMIADESPLGGDCYSPHTLFRFRRWLQQRYGTLNALNREWKTTFADWSAVIPGGPADHRHPGSHVDFAIFTQWVFAEFANFLEILLQEHSPDFRAGHSGGLKGNVMMQQAGALYYYGVTEPSVSMKQAGAVIGSWYGPGYRFVENHESTCRHWPWWHLFRGSTRIQLWYPKEGVPAVHGDWSRPFAAFQWLAEEMADIRRGAGRLLLAASRDEGHVAIYHSQRSRLIAKTLQTLKGSAGATANRVPPETVLYPIKTGWQEAFLDRHVECRFLAEFQVEAGQLSNRACKLLVLPNVHSLSAQEQQSILAFVAAGGVVVADLPPGLRNEHGSWLGDDFCQRLFGVTIAAPEGHLELAPPSPLQVNPASPFPSVANLKVPVTPAVIKPTTATVHGTAGEQAALLEQQHGKGRAFLLNLRTARQDRLLRALSADLLALTTVSPLLDVPDNGHVAPSIDFGRFHHANETYIGLVARPGKGRSNVQTATLHLKQAGHLYDMRQGRYLGHRQRTVCELRPGVAQLYSQLPYRLMALNIDAAPSGRRGEAMTLTVRSQTEGPSPQRQIWDVNVRDADGRQQRAHCRSVEVREGSAQIVVPLAENAPLGRWHVSIRDAATGVTGNIAIEVAP